MELKEYLSMCVALRLGSAAARAACVRDINLGRSARRAARACFSSLGWEKGWGEPALEGERGQAVSDALLGTLWARFDAGLGPGSSLSVSQAGLHLL